MKTLTIFCMLASLAHAEWPTRGVFANGSSSHNGIGYRYATVVEPVTEGKRWGNAIGSGFRYTSGKEHRVFWDVSSHVYFGYDLVVERTGTPGACLVTVSPLSLTLENFTTRLGSEAASYRPLSLPAYPAQQSVSVSDTIVLDLLVSPDGRQKVVDYIQVACDEAGALNIAGPSGVSAGPRDFSTRDLELRLVDPTLVVNDRPVDVPGWHGEAIGGVLWFSVPGKGRFLLSLHPYPSAGFRRAGTLSGNTFSFSAGGDRYQLISREPVFRTGQQWNLYVRLDDSRPNEPAAFGVTDRLLNGR